MKEETVKKTSFAPSFLAIATASALTVGVALPAATVTAGAQETTASTINAAKQGSLTLFKKADPENTGEPTGQPDANVSGQPLEGVGFSIYKVEGVDLTTNEGLANAADLTVADAKGRIGGAATKSGTTDAEGKVSFDGLELGVYLVRETSPKEGYAPAADFLAYIPMTKENKEQGGTEWMYDVTAYPKNYLEEGPTKEVKDSGKNVTQQIEYTIKTHAQRVREDQQRTKFVIRDVLHDSLDAANAEVSVAGQKYQADADYRVERNGQQIDIVFTEAGVAKIENNEEIDAVIKTTVKDMPEGGILKNKATQIENNPDNVQEDKTRETPEVETHYAGVNFKKVGDNRAALQGAEFSVYGAKDNEQCSAVVDNQDRLQTALGGTNTWTSGEDGVVTINGLHVNNYADGKDQPNEWTKYCLKETKSPAGYELLAQPIEFQLTTAGEQKPLTVGDNAGEIVNLKDSTPRLPLTGGMGIGVLAALGALIIALGVFVARRNSQQA